CETCASFRTATGAHRVVHSRERPTAYVPGERYDAILPRRTATAQTTKTPGQPRLPHRAAHNRPSRRPKAWKRVQCYELAMPKLWPVARSNCHANRIGSNRDRPQANRDGVLCEAKSAQHRMTIGIQGSP